MASLRLTILLTLSSISTFAATVTPNLLHRAARNHGKLFFGTAVEIPGAEQQDKRYMAILNNTAEFGQMTPADSMKWENTEPSPGIFTYGGGDTVLSIARSRKKLVRCHNLVWHYQLPDWITNGTWTNETLTAAMQRHIEALVGYWSDSCYAWDVVNEAFNDDGTYASGIFYDTIGPEYVPLAFQFASDAVKKTGKTIKLFYNDYNIEWPNLKTNAVLDLVRQLQSRGIQIDGVGLQSHFLVGSTPSKQAQVQAKNLYTSLGMEVHMTELDVRFTFLPATTDSGPNSYQQQARDYYKSIASCMAVKKCVGITTWDFCDLYSWVQYFYQGEGQADLYFANLTQKPAHQASWEALARRTCSVCGTAV